MSMKEIYDVNVKMTTTGRMVIVVKYVEKGKNETKIEPFSEELLLKYKKIYEKQKAYRVKMNNKINMKTKTKVNFNKEFFFDTALTGGALVIVTAALATAAFIGAKSFMGIIDDFKSMDSPILPEEEIEYSIDMHK